MERFPESCGISVGEAGLRALAYGLTVLEASQRQLERAGRARTETLENDPFKGGWQGAAQTLAGASAWAAAGAACVGAGTPGRIADSGPLCGSIPARPILVGFALAAPCQSLPHRQLAGHALEDCSLLTRQPAARGT